MRSALMDTSFENPQIALKWPLSWKWNEMNKLRNNTAFIMLVTNLYNEASNNLDEFRETEIGQRWIGLW